MNNKYTHIGKDKKQFVQTMFDKISFKYDFFNHLTTFYIDKYWRYQFIRKLNIKQGMNVLDIATGTGDVIIKICSKNKNINGIGAKIVLTQNDFAQKQEIISAGRYLSSDHSVRTFGVQNRVSDISFKPILKSIMKEELIKIKNAIESSEINGEIISTETFRPI